MVEKLPVGTYTLREEQAPDGYLVAEEVSFEVKDTGEIQKVEMKDARPVENWFLRNRCRRMAPLLLEQSLTSDQEIWKSCGNPCHR